MDATLARTPAQQTAIALMLTERELTREQLRDADIHPATIDALTRQGVLADDGLGWLSYRGEPDAPVYELHDGWAWRCTCGSRGCGGSKGEAADWRDCHLRDCH